MATKKIPFVKYKNNVKKSVMMITSEALTEDLPTINSYRRQINDMRRDVIVAAKTNNTSIGKMIRQNLKDKLSPLSEVLEKARDELRTGNFYSSDSESTDIDDMGLGIETENTNPTTSDNSGIDASSALSGTALNNISTSTLAGSQYMAEVSMNNTSQMMTMSLDNHKELINSITNLQNIGMNIVKFNNTIVKQNIEKANAYYDQALSKLDEIKEAIKTNSNVQLQIYGNQNGIEASTSQLSNLLDSSDGSVDLRAYFKQIKSNISENVPINIEEIAQMIGANPIASIGKFALSSLLPKNLKASASNYNTLMSAMFPMFLMKMNDLSKNSSNTITKFLGKMFKADMESNTSINFASYKDAPMTLEIEQKKAKAITEVIPTYLSEITRALTGSNMLFDYSKGKFMTKSDMTKEANSVFKNNITGSMMNTRGILSGMASKLGLDKKSFDALQEDIDNFLVYTVLSGQGFNPTKKMNKQKMANNGLSMNDWSNLDLIRAMFAAMPKTSQANSQKELLDALKYLQESATSSNGLLNSSGIIASIMGFQEGTGGRYGNFVPTSNIGQSSNSKMSNTMKQKFNGKTSEAYKFFENIAKNNNINDLKFQFNDDNDEEDDLFSQVKDKVTNSRVAKGARGIKDKFDKKVNNLTSFVSGIIDTVSDGIYGVMFNNKSPGEVIGQTMHSIGKSMAMKESEGGWYGNMHQWLPRSLYAASAGGLLAKLSGANAFGMMALPFVSAGITFMHNSKKMQDVLFGEFDEKGNKIEGKEGIFKFVSKDVKDAIVDFLPKAKNGAIVGGLAGLVFKHPVLGASIGAAVNLLKSTKAVQDFLWGNEETGETGLLGGARKWVSEKWKSAKNWASEKTKPMYDKLMSWLGLDKGFNNSIFEKQDIEDEDEDNDDIINALNNAKVGNDADQMIATEFRSGIPDITNGNIIDYRKYFASIIDRMASIEARMDSVKDVKIVYGQSDLPVYVQMINPEDEEINKVMKQNNPNIGVSESQPILGSVSNGASSQINNNIKANNRLKAVLSKRQLKFSRVLKRQVRQTSSENRSYENIVNDMSDDEFYEVAPDIISNPNVDKNIKKKVKSRYKKISKEKKSSSKIKYDSIFKGLDFTFGGGSQKSLTNMGKFSGGLVGAALGSMLLGNPLLGLYSGLMFSKHKDKSKDPNFKRHLQIGGSLGGGILSSMMGLGILPGMAFGSIFNGNNDNGKPKLMDHITGGGKLSGMGLGALGGLLFSNPMLGAALGLALSTSKDKLKGNTLNGNITKWFSDIRGEDTSQLKLMDQLTGGGKYRGALAGMGLGTLFGGPLGALIGLGTGLATSSFRKDLGDNAKGGIINRLTGIKSGKGWALGALAGLALGHPFLGPMLGFALSKNGEKKSKSYEEWWSMLSKDQRKQLKKDNEGKNKKELYELNKDDHKYAKYNLWWNSLDDIEQRKIKHENKGKKIKDIYEEKYEKNKDVDPEKKGLIASLNGKFAVSRGKASAYGGILANVLGINPLIGMAAGALLGGKKDTKPDGSRAKPYIVKDYDSMTEKEKKSKDGPFSTAWNKIKGGAKKVKGFFNKDKTDDEEKKEEKKDGGRGIIRWFGRGANASKHKVDNTVDKYISYAKSKSADQVDRWYNSTLKNLSPDEANAVMARVDSLNSNNTASAVKTITTDEKGKGFSLGGIFSKIGSFLSNLLPIGIALFQLLRLKGGGGFGSENEYGDANFANIGDRGLYTLTSVVGRKALGKVATTVMGKGLGGKIAGAAFGQSFSALSASSFYRKQTKAYKDRGDDTGNVAESRYGWMSNTAKAVWYGAKGMQKLATKSKVAAKIVNGVKTVINKLLKNGKISKLLSKSGAQVGEELAEKVAQWTGKTLIPNLIKKAGNLIGKITEKLTTVASVVLSWLPLATAIVAFINGWNNVSNELQLSSDYKPSWKERLTCAIVYALDDVLCGAIDILGLRDDIISWILNFFGVNKEERAASKIKAATEYEQFLKDNDLNREGFTMEQYQNLTNKTIWGHVKSAFGGNNLDDYKKGGKKYDKMHDKYGGYKAQESSGDGMTMIVQDNSITNIQGATGGRGIDPYLLKTKMRVAQTSRTNEDVAAKVLSGNLASKVINGDTKTLNDINNKTGGNGKKNGIWARIKGVASNAGTWIKNKVTSGIQAVKNFFTGGRGDDDYYNQQDPRWGNMSFGRYAGHRDTVGDGGCGPTTAAMAIQDLTGRKVTPAETSRYALSNGYKLDDGGTTPDYFSSIGKKYGVNFNETNPLGSDTMSSLRNGNPVIFMGQDRTGTSPFGSNSHYVIANGMDNNGNVMVRDPKRSENNGMWNIADIAANATNAIAGGRGGFADRYRFGGRGGLGSSEVKEFSLANDGEKNISTNFKIKEFACHDGGDTIKIGVALVNGLEKLRAYVGKPLTINSAYRSPSYNSSIGGAKKSNHMKGIAADISATNLGITPIQLAAIAKHIGFTGVIYYDTFVHMDTRADCGMNEYYGKSLGSGKCQAVSNFGPLPNSANGSVGSINTSVGTTTSSGTSSNSSSTSDDGTEGKGFGSRVSNFLKNLGVGNAFFDRVSNFTTALSNRFYGTAEASTNSSSSGSSSLSQSSGVDPVAATVGSSNGKDFAGYVPLTNTAKNDKAYKDNIDGLIEKYCKEYNLDSNWVKALMKAESTLGHDSSSMKPNPQGYAGLMQISVKANPNWADDEANIKAGVAHLAGIANKSWIDNYYEAIAGYNTGENKPYYKNQTITPEWMAKNGDSPQARSHLPKVAKFYSEYMAGGRGSNTHARVVPPSIRVANAAQRKSINTAKQSIRTASASVNNSQQYKTNTTHSISGGRDNSSQYDNETMKNMVVMMNSMLAVLENIANTNAIIASNSKTQQVSHKASLMNDIVAG